MQVLCLEKSLEEMLTRVDEFVGMLDMVRSMSLHLVAFSIFIFSPSLNFKLVKKVLNAKPHLRNAYF